MFAFPETVGVKLLVTEEALFKQPAADSSSSLKDATWTDATAPGGGGGGGVSSVPPPVLFSFVLTDEKSRRLYATALRVRPSIFFLEASCTFVLSFVSLTPYCIIYYWSNIHPFSSYRCTSKCHSWAWLTLWRM